MKQKVCSHWKKGFIATFIALVLVFACLTSATAITVTTGVYIGTGNVYFANGSIDYDVKGYVYYNSNTTAAIDISSMVQWVYNYGIYDVELMEFEARDGKSYETTNGNYVIKVHEIEPIATGKNSRVEIDWETFCLSGGMSNVYEKNTSSKFATTDITAGTDSLLIGGWLSYWYQTNRDDKFHY